MTILLRQDIGRFISSHDPREELNYGHLNQAFGFGGIFFMVGQIGEEKNAVGEQYFGVEEKWYAANIRHNQSRKRNDFTRTITGDYRHT